MSGPPRPDNTLPGDLPAPGLPIPPGQPPFPDNSLPWPQPPYDNIDKEDVPPLFYLRIFYPGFFDPTGPNYVEPIQVIVALGIANEMKPWCLKPKMQWIAQAHYAAYLLQEHLKNKASGGIGGSGEINSGIVLSEREGDVAKTYADPRTSSGSSAMDDAPPNSAYAKWSKLNDLCKYGAILTQYGDPVGRNS